MNELPWFQSLRWRAFFVFLGCFVLAAIPVWIAVRAAELSADPVREVDRALGLMTLAGILAAAVSAMIAGRYFRHRLASSQRIVEGAVVEESAARRGPDEIVVFVADVVEAKEKLRNEIMRLQREKARLSALVTSMGEAVVVIDDEERVVLVNPEAEKLLRLPGESRGERLADLVEVPRLLAIAADVLWSGEMANEDLDIAQREDVRHISLTASPIVVEERVSGAVLLLYDVTRLRRLERVRRDFVANVSHELRTPIATIQSSAETLLLAELPIEEVMSDFIQTIERNAQRMAAIVTDLLTLSRLEASGEALALHEVDIAPILRAMEQHCRPLAEAKGLTFSVHIDEELPTALGEEVAIRQVVQNLVENAIKYTPEGGEVSVHARVKNKKRLRIDVADTGYGIPTEHLPRIFERFYRVDVGRSREIGGTGLGLAIVKHLMRNMLGRITVESEVGAGTTFKVWLRIFDPERAR